MTTTPITPAALSPQREAKYRELVAVATPGPWEADGWEINSSSGWIGETCDVDSFLKSRADAAFIATARTAVPELLAEIDRLRAERHETNKALADITVAQRAERDAAEVEVASSNAQWEHWAAVAERLQKRVAELERVAVEGRAALAALCYDLEDPGTAALGALYLLQQATTWTEAKPDEAALALARHDAEVLHKAADEIEAHCPDHGHRDTAFVTCQCLAVDDLRRQADAAERTNEPQVDLRAGQLAEQRHTFLDLDPDSACRPAGFTCPAAHTAPELEATR